MPSGLPLPSSRTRPISRWPELLSVAMVGAVTVPLAPVSRIVAMKSPRSSVAIHVPRGRARDNGSPWSTLAPSWDNLSAQAGEPDDEVLDGDPHLGRQVARRRVDEVHRR